MKHQQEYAYQYPHSQKQLIDELNNRRGMDHNWNYGEYLIDIKNDNFFFLGVQRGGHSGGYWYVARIEENDIGSLIIRGSIVYNPDSNGIPPTETLKDKVGFLLLFIFLLPVIIVIKAIQLLHILWLKIKTKPLPRPDTEEKLDRFMIDYLCCSKL